METQATTPFKPSDAVIETTTLVVDDAPVAVDNDGAITHLTRLTVPAIPTASDLMEPAKMALDSMKITTVNSAAEAEFALEDLRGVKSSLADLEARRTAITAPLNDKVKEVNNIFRPAREAYEEAERLGKSLLLDFDRREAQRVENERRAAAAAAEAERQRLQKIADDAQRAADEEAARLREVADKAQRDAEAAIAAGNADAAEAATAAQVQAEASARQVQAEASATAQVMEQTSQAISSAALHVVRPATTARKGASNRSKWVASITDKATALRHIAADPSLHNMVEFNMSALNKLADAQREGFNLPGMQALQEFSLGVKKA